LAHSPTSEEILQSFVRDNRLASLYASCAQLSPQINYVDKTTHQTKQELKRLICPLLEYGYQKIV